MDKAVEDSAGEEREEVSVKKEVANQLKKVELVYEEFRIEIVGKISSGKIAPIMGILEE